MSGWGTPRPDQPWVKYHYFVAGKSLCNKFMDTLGRIRLEPRSDHAVTNCARCRTRKHGALGAI